MKNLGKLAVLGAVLATSATMAFAAPILLTGGLTVSGNDKTDDSFTTNSISFSTPTGSPAANALVTGATGNLTFASGSTGIMTGFTSSATNQIIFTDNDTQGLSFELLSIAVFTDTYDAGYGTDLVIKGTGEFLDTAGDTPEMGTFELSSTDTACKGTSCTTPDNISFGFTPVAVPPAITPEPSSLLLLGSGLVGVAGMARRRFQALR